MNKIYITKKITLQDQGKYDPIELSRMELNFGLIFFNIDEGPIPNNLYDYDYNEEGLDHSVHGAECIPERRELKNFLDIRRCKWLRKTLN